MKIALISYHYWGSKRKAGFHNLAQAFVNLGHEVLFVTAPISWLSWLRRDFRFQYDVLGERGRLLPKGPGIFSYVHFTPFHAGDLRNGWLNRLSAPLFRTYPRFSLGEAGPFLEKCDALVFESSPALLLVDALKKLTPQAKMIYRVSDDLKTLGCHPVVIEAEEALAPKFDLISSPSPTLHRRLSHLPNSRLHFHAIQKSAFQNSKNPYEGRAKRLVFVGHGHFDDSFLEIAAASFPEHDFHILGDVPANVSAPNIKFHGEVPFLDTVGYLQNADVGLATWHFKSGWEHYSDSLKIIQYTYCSLPILLPEQVPSDRKHVFHYRIGDRASIESAIRGALKFDRSRVDRSQILDWTELAKQLLQEAGALG